MNESINSTPIGYILESLLPEWRDAFVANNREYGDMHTELGIAAQYVDMHRKMGKLRKALWDREDTSQWRESPREIVMDLVGHCFLMLERMDYEGLYPTTKRGRADEFLPQSTDQPTRIRRVYQESQDPPYTEVTKATCAEHPRPKRGMFTPNNLPDQTAILPAIKEDSAGPIERETLESIRRAAASPNIPTDRS